MLDLLVKGGWLLVPIVVGSLVALALFLERLVALRRSRINPPRLFRELRELLGQRQWHEAKLLCRSHTSALARIWRVGLAHLERAPAKGELKEVLEEVGQRETFFLERGIGAVGVVASLEPLLGLLGTVIGMIKAFQRVAVGGVGDPRLVAEGVWVALLTTAAGLLVAIPAYIAYRYLLARVDRLTMELQNDVSQLLDVLYRTPVRGGVAQSSEAKAHVGGSGSGYPFVPDVAS